MPEPKETAPTQNAADTAPTTATAKTPAKFKPKKASRKKASAKKAAEQKSARKARTSRSYPARTLEEALLIPKAIREQNNGNPWDTEDVAQASLGVAKNNNKFFYAAASARDYGLTTGTRDTEKIELAPIG